MAIRAFNFNANGIGPKVLWLAGTSKYAAERALGFRLQRLVVLISNPRRVGANA